MKQKTGKKKMLCMRWGKCGAKKCPIKSNILKLKVYSVFVLGDCAGVKEGIVEAMK